LKTRAESLWVLLPAACREFVLPAKAGIQKTRQDSEGIASFAIVSHGGFLGFYEKKVAVLYSALTYDKERQHFTCAISKDRFESAPNIEDKAKLHDRSFAEEVYRYFGQHPYWTDESMEKSKAMESKGVEESMGIGAWDYY